MHNIKRNALNHPKRAHWTSRINTCAAHKIISDYRFANFWRELFDKATKYFHCAYVGFPKLRIDSQIDLVEPLGWYGWSVIQGGPEGRLISLLTRCQLSGCRGSLPHKTRPRKVPTMVDGRRVSITIIPLEGRSSRRLGSLRGESLCALIRCPLSTGGSKTASPRASGSAASRVRPCRIPSRFTSGGAVGPLVVGPSGQWMVSVHGGSGDWGWVVETGSAQLVEKLV